MLIILLVNSIKWMIPKENSKLIVFQSNRSKQVQLIYKYSYIYIYMNLPINAIFRLPHPRNGDSQGQETFLTPSTDKQTRNYDKECSNHHPSLSTLRPKVLSRSKMKWYLCIYIYIYCCIFIFRITFIIIMNLSNICDGAFCKNI